MDIESLHKELVKLLLDFNAICKKNNINYTLHGGSLLGAIREQGFIPWDDDADVAMTRAEFKKLVQALKYNENYYIYGDIKKQFRKKRDDFLWIDIFICDYIGTGISRKLKLSFLTILDIMSRNKENIHLSNLSSYNFKKQIAFKCLYFLGRLFPRRLKIYLYNNISEYRWLGNQLLMHRSNDQYNGRTAEFPAIWMQSFYDVPFEGIRLSVMQAYHDMLVKCYGENYMIPVKDVRNSSIHDFVRASGGKNIKL